jgi:hypothetical protein
MDKAYVDALLTRVHEALFNPTLFDDLVEQRKEIAELLESHDLDLTTDQEEFLNLHPAGVERLYEFLAQGDSSAPAESEALAAAFAVREEDEQRIGTLFKNGLCRDLGEMANPTKYFKGENLELAPAELVESLERRKDVQAAQPAIVPLLRYGLTPTSVFLTCDAPRTLAMRWDYRDSVILTPKQTREQKRGTFLLSQVAQEAASLADGRSAYYLPLVKWLCDIQRQDFSTRRFLFRGFETISEGDDLRLVPLEGDQPLKKMNLDLQWSPEKVPKKVPEAVAAYA